MLQSAFGLHPSPRKDDAGRVLLKMAKYGRLGPLHFLQSIRIFPRQTIKRSEDEIKRQ